MNDKSPKCYETYVDKLLASPQWGEQRARYWLDGARYADTNGIHFDNYREVWSFRDWVIRSFNENKKFDQFTIEQLAGDLLPNPNLDQRIATGFNRCNETTNEGGAINEEYLVLYARDRTETVSQVWMGLTAGCAVCHNHKYDPITQADFYSLSAYFNNTTQAAMDGNISDTPPILVVPRMEDRSKWDALTKERAEVQKKIEARKKEARVEFDAWLAKVDPKEIYAKASVNSLYLKIPFTDGKGDQVKAILNGKTSEVKAILEDKPAPVKPIADEKPVPVKPIADKKPVPVKPIPEEKSKEVKPSADLAWEAGAVAPMAYSSDPDHVLALSDACDFEKDEPFSISGWVRINRRGEIGAIVSPMQRSR